MKKTTDVKAHTKHTKSGKIVNVKASKREYDAAEDIAKEAIRKAKGAGSEFEKRKAKPTDYDQYGFTKEEFEAWYENTDPKTFRKVEKALKEVMGADGWKAFKKSDAYNEYTKGGADKFFKKSLRTMEAFTGKKSDKPESKVSDKSAVGISKDDWNDYYGAGGSGSSKAGKNIDSAVRKYLGAKAYKKWAEYQDNSDDNGGSYKGFLKQIEKFKNGDYESAAKGKSKKDKESHEKEYGEKTSKMSYDDLKKKYSIAIHPAHDDKAAARKYSKLLSPMIEERIKSGKATAWDRKIADKLGIGSSKESITDSSKSDRTKYMGVTMDGGQKYYVAGNKVYSKVGDKMVELRKGSDKGTKEGIPSKLYNDILFKAIDTTHKRNKIAPKVADSSKGKSTDFSKDWNKYATKDALQKLSFDDRRALNQAVTEAYKGKTFKLDNSDSHVYYKVAGFGITNEGTSAPESRKQFGVYMKPYSTGASDPGGYRYIPLKDLDKYDESKIKPSASKPQSDAEFLSGMYKKYYRKRF